MGSAELLTLGARGAPQLLQAAFHANGEMVTDHVHPSPWLMELAGSYDAVLSEDLAVSFYAAAIGEPVLGPPVYLHRASATANPVVPLGHHLQDDTHSSYGVLSYGMRWPGVQWSVSQRTSPLFVSCPRYAPSASFSMVAWVCLIFDS